MSDRHFIERVTADTAGDAFRKVGPQHGKTAWSEVLDEPRDVRKQIEAKLQRVQENPKLYADRIAEYEETLHELEWNISSMSNAEAVAWAMLSHGDSRVDNPARCAVMYSQHKSEWLVFGYRKVE